MSHVNVKDFSTTHLTSFQISLNMILEVKVYSFFVLICRGLYILPQVSKKKGDQKFEIQ